MEFQNGMNYSEGHLHIGGLKSSPKAIPAPMTFVIQDLGD